MNTPVDFELAKLLKQKGYNEEIRTAWYIEEVAYWKIPTNHNDSNNKVSAPTIAEVVMWLYEKHGIWIMVKRLDYEKLVRWDFYVDNNFVKLSLIGYDSPTEAYESGIKYVLINLIQ